SSKVPFSAAAVRAGVVQRPFLRHKHVTFATLVSSPKTDLGAEKPTKLELRDYQLDCIKSVVKSTKRGVKRVGVSLATGSGKTVIFTQLIGKIQDRLNGGSRTLILAHRRELVEQAAKHCRLAYPEKSIDIEMGSLSASGAADITIASVQSIISKDRIEKYDPSSFKLVLVDEAHHIVSPSYLRVLSHFGLDQKRHNSPLLVGVSATFSRFDGVKLGSAIDEIVYHKDYTEMISDNWLSDVVFTTVKSTANLSRVRSGNTGDFSTGELSRAVNTDELNNITVRSWMAKAAGRKSTLVFCVDLAHTRFASMGLMPDVSLETHPKLREGRFWRISKNGRFPVLLNCGVFTEGTDIPNIDCIVLGRPTKSKNLLVQMIGRGMRLHAGKKNCHIIDFVSSLETGIVTTPTLFGLDPNLLVDRANVDEMIAAQRRKTADDKKKAEAAARSGHPAATAVAFTDYSSVLDLIADSSGERHIRAVSEFAWVQVGPEKFILSAPSGSYIRIERIEDDIVRSGDQSPKYRAVEIRSLLPGTSKSPFAAPREILTAATFSDAVHGADSYASHAFPFSFIHRRQPWRNLPPTQGQLDFINKLRGEGKPLRVQQLSKGKAADMITKLKHGARGQFARLEAQKKRQVKQEMLAQPSSREQVRVGPLES
ncbi:unnamed protein product, partial [Clonostachys rosea f. rosea IK726]